MKRNSTLGSCIRSLRIHNRMTQAQLADKIGVTDKAVSKWERDLSYPDILLFPKLADIFGVTVNDLLMESSDEFRTSRLLKIFEMSHDIRTPLHIMLGFVEIAKQDLDDKELLMKHLCSIKVSGEYLLKMIERIIETTDQERKGEKTAESGEDELEEILKSRSEMPEAPPAVCDLSGKTILVAEDMEVNREIAAGMLKLTGADVEFAADGQECLQKVEEAPSDHYDLILMDIRMPVMDGLEATRRIRELADQKKAGIPVIAVTANAYERDREAAFAAGMNAFAEKPVLTDELFSVMKTVLEK